MKLNLTRKTLTRRLVLGLSVICLAGFTSAQEDEDVQAPGETVEMTVIGGDELGGAPMIFQTTESFEGGEARTGMRIMSGGPGTMAFVGGMGGDFVMPAPDAFSLIGNPSVQKDLELVGDQLKSVQDMQAMFAQQMKEQIGDITKGGLNKERFKELPALIAKLKKQQREKLESMLLPHQVDRLHQVALQQHMKQAGTAGALTSEKVAEALGLTNEQIDRLKKRSKEIKAQLEKDTRALQEKAKENLLKELSVDQRNKLKEMTGDKYEPQNKDWQESIQKRVRGPRVRKQRSDN